MAKETQSKTPKFDALLDKILENLTPHKQECLQKSISKYCEGQFKITPEDINFYKLLQVPSPKCCPTCRRQKRFAFVNQINLYKRSNNAPGAQNKIVSYVPPVSSLKVYDIENYRNNFDPYTYGTFYNEKQSFFSQFLDLRLKIPQPSIIRDPSNINSEYSINGRNLKNGYYVSGGWTSESIWYCVSTSNCRSVMDSLLVRNTENSYETVSSEKCYNSRYLYFSDNCINSQFLYDCNNLIECFACVNLRNKKYCFFNEQLTKEEYEAKITELNLESRQAISNIEDRFWKFVKSHPVRASRHEQVENVSGVNIANSRNCHDINFGVDTEHSLHCDQLLGNKDSMDASVSGGSEKLYQTIGVGSSSANVKFSFLSKFIIDSEFLINCRNIQNCFACIGLENRSYCILNSQYEPEKYYQELDKIKTNLLEKSEYGEFPPFQLSTFAYNGSQADFVFPLNKAEVEKLGALWQPDTEVDTAGMLVLDANEVPDTIAEVGDDILNKAILCQETKRPFRIVTSELKFYRDNKISLPLVHPYQRIRKRFSHIGNYRMYDSVCESCGKNIKTFYTPNSGWHLFCDDCYKREFI